MGMVTLHLVIGVGVFILPLFLLLFSLISMNLAHLYIVIGSVSFVASVLTAVVLATKFVNQPEAHGFFSYSDTIASALMSLGLLLDGILYLLPDYDTPCYQYKVVYGLFIAPIVTGFFSVLGMAIERFQTFALYRDRRKATKKFSIAWTIASWTLALCFLVILLAQITEKDPGEMTSPGSRENANENANNNNNDKKNKDYFIDLLDMDLFPGPHSQKRIEEKYKKPDNYGGKLNKIRNATTNSIDTGNNSTEIPEDNRMNNSTETSTKTNSSAKLDVAIKNKEKGSKDFKEKVVTNTHGGKNKLLELFTPVPAVPDNSQTVKIPSDISGDDGQGLNQVQYNAVSLNSNDTNVECLFRYRRAAWDETADMLGNIFKIVRVPRPCSIQELEQLFNQANKTYIAKQYSNNDDKDTTNNGKKKDKGENTTKDNGSVAKGIQCRISSRPFIMYYLILLFLLCFATPVLITTSLNVFIQSAVQDTTYEVVSHHQWLTLAACVLMWGPSLLERLLAKWDVFQPPLVVSVFLFLLGHTHNLLRSVLHAVFAQQIHSLTWRGNQLDWQANRPFRWGHARESHNRVIPSFLNSPDPVNGNSNRQQQQQQQQQQLSSARERHRQRRDKNKRKGSTTSNKIRNADFNLENVRNERRTSFQQEDIVETISV